MLVIDSKLLEKILDFCSKAIDNPIKSILLIILLLLVSFIAICISYRKSVFVQKLINFLENLFFPLIKKQIIIMIVFTKKQAVTREIEKEYYLIGYKKILINLFDEFSGNEIMSENRLQKIIDKQYSKMSKVEKGMKNNNSLVYLGFPHIPIAFLDGYNFTDTDNVILYEYDGSPSNPNKKFFELERKYNSDIELDSNYINYDLRGDEIILKVEQSFKINDDELKSVVGDKDIIYLSNKDKKRWGINSYSEIDRFIKEFARILDWAKENGVKKIHLFLTTPVSLTFSLGQTINHHSPDILIYNYNNNNFDWMIDVKKRKVKVI